MPTPNVGESRSDFVARCIPVVLEDGTAENNEQAVAVCNSMFEQGSSTKGKYDDIDFSIPDSVRDEAQRGLNWRKEHNRGGTEVGVATARTLVSSERVSPKKARHIARYFPRHEVDKQADGFSPGEDGYPSAGRIAWALWGGDPGQRWSTRLVERMDKINEKTKAMDDAPNYREADDESKICSMCNYAEDGVCTAYDFKFDAGYTCDDFEPGDNENDEGVKRSPYAVKLLHEFPDYYLIGGYGHVWGDQAHKDLYDEYFTKNSDLMPDLVPIKLVLFDHNMSFAPDGSPFDHPIGEAHEKNTRIDQSGKWIEAQLNKRAQYVDQVMELVKRGVLAWSSGSVPQLVKSTADGHLTRWPVVEYTLTPTPAEPRMTEVSQLKAAYKSAGLDMLLDDETGAESRDEAEGQYREGGNREDDAAHKLALERERNRTLKLSL